METEKINEILELAETSDLSVTEIAKLEKISREEVLQLLIDNEYYDLKDKVSPRLKAARKVRAAAKYFIEHNYMIFLNFSLFFYLIFRIISYFVILNKINVDLVDVFYCFISSLPLEYIINLELWYVHPEKILSSAALNPVYIV